MFGGGVSNNSIYSDARDGGRGDFKRFLERVESKSGLLPAWWLPEKSDACMTAAMDQRRWSHLASTVEKGDLIEHYGDPMISM
jgi:splicing suppressor protein 51